MSVSPDNQGGLPERAGILNLVNFLLFFNSEYFSRQTT